MNVAWLVRGRMVIPVDGALNGILRRWVLLETVGGGHLAKGRALEATLGGGAYKREVGGLQKSGMG